MPSAWITISAPSSRSKAWSIANRSIGLDELQDLLRWHEIFGDVDHFGLRARVSPWRGGYLNLSADDAHQAGARWVKNARSRVSGRCHIGDQGVESSPLQIRR